MNASDMYLYNILQKYNARDLTNYAYQILALKAKLQAWAGTCYIEIIDSGSRAKGTAISLASDVDYLVSLTSQCNENTGGLKSIYDSLYTTLRSTYSNARKQNVSVRIDLAGNMPINNLEVDITPARKQDIYTTDHSLWLSKNNTWKKTNIHKHIFDISNSGRIDEIKLLKIWRELNRLDIPSIYLEYLIIGNILINKPKGMDYLSNNFYEILCALARPHNSNPLFSQVIDPANSNNVLSDLLTVTEKNQIIIKAQFSVRQSDWSRIVF